MVSYRGKDTFVYSYSAHNAIEKLSLSTLPMELQLEILRYTLNADDMLSLNPFNTCYGLGSLGILRVSKYFSTLGLCILYGENSFDLAAYETYEIRRQASTKLTQVAHTELKNSRWSIIRDIPNEELGIVSGVDCLDMLSQTAPGQKHLKRLHIGFTTFALARFMDGVLPRILRRMRGLQELVLTLEESWEDMIPGQPASSYNHTDSDWEESYARDFLLLLMTELAHVKMICVNVFKYDRIGSWVAHEFEKRNKIWVAPYPARRKFQRTVSNMSILDSEVAKSVVVMDQEYKSKLDEYSPQFLVRKYGGFEWLRSY